MTPINQWAARWRIPHEAISELQAVMGACAPVPATNPAAGEAVVQQQVRLRAAQLGRRLFRNNVGACEDKSGRIIRYGLANDSAQMNRVFKSSDLIGITPVRCECGKLYGVFTAYECKRGDWKFSLSDERAVGQLAFIQFVTSYGGIAKFVTGEEQI